jgi:hypothetical protein
MMMIMIARGGRGSAISYILPNEQTKSQLRAVVILSLARGRTY